MLFGIWKVLFRGAELYREEATNAGNDGQVRPRHA